MRRAALRGESSENKYHRAEEQGTKIVQLVRFVRKLMCDDRNSYAVPFLAASAFFFDNS